MPERHCVYTVLTGGFENLLDQPVASSSAVDFICFTDDLSQSSATWQLRPIDLLFPADPARSARWVKLCPHRFLPDYDVSLYIDNCVGLRQAPEVIIDALLPRDVGFAAMEHPYRDTVEDEFEAVRSGNELEAPWVLSEQLEHYQMSNAGVLKSQPLCGGFLLRRHNRPDVVAAMERWYQHVLRYARRDQLSLLAAMREADLEPHVVPLDIRDNHYCHWPVAAGRRGQRRGALPTVPELVDAEKRLADVESHAAAVEAELRGVSRELDGSLRRLAQVEASTSWRITRPLRHVGRLARQVGRLSLSTRRTS